jgi:L-histidine N-alpha-methyltransferase
MKITNLSLSIKTEKLIAKNSFSIDVDQGLSLQHKAISSKYFYDDIGSKLFQKITKHTDYYPTRTETQILHSIKDKLPKLIKLNEIDIIELGPGDGTKGKIIIDGFLKNDYKVNYYPIDISKKALQLLSKNLPPNKNLFVHGIIGEYLDGLKLIKKESKNKQLVVFLGSSIGNFNTKQSKKFLTNIYKNISNNSYMFTGFDLKKNLSVLNKAYNDSSGLTRKFNLNILNRINNDLKGEFKLKNFIHFGNYNPVLGTMESYLISLIKQNVWIKKLNKSFKFEVFEPIHLEYSFKYSEDNISDLATSSNFKIIKNYTDEKKYFINSIWKKSID